MHRRIFCPIQTQDMHQKQGKISNTSFYRCLRRIVAANGSEGFYKGATAQAIETLTSVGNLMTLEDLASHTSTVVDPISVSFGIKFVYGRFLSNT
jgi:gamma-glutamyltranspeptidase